MKTKKIVLLIVAFMLIVSLAVVSNAENVDRDIDVEVDYTRAVNSKKLKFTITLKNGAVLLGDVNGDGYVSDPDLTILTKILDGTTTWETEFGNDVTRAMQAADIYDRGNSQNAPEVDVNDSAKLQEYFNQGLEGDVDYAFGFEAGGTLLLDSNFKFKSTNTRITEGVAEGETKYVVEYTFNEVPSLMKTIGVKIPKGAIGYVGNEPYANTQTTGFIYTIGEDMMDSISLSEGIKSDNKVTFNIAPDGTGLRGDANEDGTVNSKDSELINKYGGEYNVEINATLADYNLDGVIHLLDSNEILSIESYNPIELKGTLAGQSSYKLIKNNNGKYSIEVTIPENATEGTIGVVLKEAMFVTPDKKLNLEASKSFKLVPEKEDDEEENKTALKVVSKTEEKQNDGKVKVTITVNKELDPDKVPSGWELAANKKSISKIMKAGATEKITLVAEDGTTLKYTVTTEKEGQALKKVKFNNHEYYIFEKNMTWKEAKAFCEKQGGYLVTITSKEEQKFIENLINDNSVKNKRFWIGATDADKEGVWKWVTGEKFDYNNWGEKQPDNLRDQDYALIQNYVIEKYSINVNEWDDIKSEETNYFICEWGDIEVDKEKLPTKLPQAGLGTTLTFAVVVVAGIALISLKKYRDFKDIK